MATQASSTVYPLDPTGSLASNKILAEPQVLTAANGSKFRMLVPTYAPYFEASVVMTITDPTGGVKTMVNGVDWYAGYIFLSASRACASPVGGAIVIMDATLVGTLSITYQTLGGDYTLDLNTLTELVANAVINPVITSWEDITGLPTNYPPVDHVWDVADLTGAFDVIASIDALTAAYLASGDAGLATHEADHNNPHVVTAAQVGAYTIAQADSAIAAAGVTLSQATALVQTNLTTHINNTNNPHQTTAAEVGLGNVGNFTIASDADAAAGTSTQLYMTPRGVLIAMNAGPSSALNLHLIDYTNPHKTTAAQIGLGLVSNYATATNAQALAGASASTFLTPASLAYTLTNGVGGTITTHVANMSNPHDTTAAQVGLGNVLNYGIATSADAIAGTSNILYVTPASVKAAINGITSTQLLAHTANTSNPHVTTAAQVGAYTTAQVDAALLLKLGTTAQAADSALFAGQTPAAFTTSVLGGTAANATLFGGNTVAQLTASILTGTAANALEINGYTISQLDTRYILANKAAKQGILSQQSSGASAANIWVALGTITLPTDLTVVNNQLPDLQFYVAGGDAQASTSSSLYYVRMSTRGGSTASFAMSSKSIGTFAGTATFGYSVASGVLTLWMKSVDSIAQTTITEFQQSTMVVSTSATPVTSAPTGFIAATAS